MGGCVHSVEEALEERAHCSVWADGDWNERHVIVDDVSNYFVSAELVIVVSLSVFPFLQNLTFSPSRRRKFISFFLACKVVREEGAFGLEDITVTSNPRRVRQHRHAVLSRRCSMRMLMSKGRMVCVGFYYFIGLY